MYFEDLSAYGYSRLNNEGVVLNIGWLDAGKPFNQAEASETVLSALFTACEHRVNQTRGFHFCPFCNKLHDGILVEEVNGWKIFLGSAEIRVRGVGVVYAAPTLIYHYIKDHKYDPPDEFKKALLQAYPPEMPNRPQLLE